MHKLIIPKTLSYLADNGLIKPIHWNLTLDYGFYYSRDASDISKRFLDYLQRHQ